MRWDREKGNGPLPRHFPCQPPQAGPGWGPADPSVVMLCPETGSRGLGGLWMRGDLQKATGPPVWGEDRARGAGAEPEGSPFRLPAPQLHRDPLKMHRCLWGKNFRRSGKSITLSSLIRRNGGVFFPPPVCLKYRQKRGYFCPATSPWVHHEVSTGSAQTWARRTQLSPQRRENSAHPTPAEDIGTLRQLSPPPLQGQQLSLPFAEQSWEQPL